MLLRPASITAITFATLFASPVDAITLTVGPGGDCSTTSIGAAITTAGLLGPALDEIRISAGQYGNQALVVRNQSLRISGGWSDCSAQATVSGRSTISGNGADSVLTAIESDGSSHELHLDRINVHAGGGGGDGIGGGIEIRGRWQASLRRAEISHNSTEFDGGGIAIEGPGSLSPASIDIGEDVALSLNEARNGNGGGIHGKYAVVKLRADRVTVFGNSAYRGGGIAATSANVYVGAFGDEIPFTQATGLIVEGNRAYEGGGIALLGSGWLFDANELTVRNNIAQHLGGGIYAVNGQLQLQRDYPNYWRVQCAAGAFCSRIEGNVAGANCPSEAAGRGHGGGLYLDRVNAYISQTLISDNCAYGSPAFFSWGPGSRFESTVIARNLMRDRSDQYDQTGGSIIGLGSRTGDPNQFAILRGISLFDNRAQTTAGSRVPAPLFSGASNAATQFIAVAYDQGFSSGGGNSACVIGGVGRSGYRDVDSNDFRPSATSAQVDACPAETFAANYAGMDLQPRCVDDPNYQRGGTCDIGAMEAPLDAFFAGFANDFE